MKRSLLCALCALGLWGCSSDPRVAKDAANTIVATTLRSYGVEQADAVALASLEAERALPLIGSQDLVGAQAAWIRARLAYDRGTALFKLAAPELDVLIDGELDNPLTRTGLRIFEQPLFGLPTADALTLNRGGRALSEAAVRLPVAMADTGRTLDVGALFGAMSGLVVVMGTKLDGSDSPFAHQSLLSARMGLGGIFAMYQPLSKLIHSVDAALDDQIQALLSVLLGQLDGVTNTDQVRDKALFLRRSAELSQVLLQVAPALGLTVTAVVDVT